MPALVRRTGGDPRETLWRLWRAEYEDARIEYRRHDTLAGRQRLSAAIRALKALAAGDLPEDTPR